MNYVELDFSHIQKPDPTMDYRLVRGRIYDERTAEKDFAVTIIVQAFDRLEKTRECIESIFCYTQGVNYKLLLLDNGSKSEDVTEYFKSVAYEFKTIIRINKNITGCYALNAALHFVDTRYVAIVNNDIIVTANWLHNLLVCIESDASIGMVCPVSTHMSNRQEETLGGFDSLEEMQAKARQFNISNPSLWEEKIRLIPSVVLYRMEILDTVGAYDTGFVHEFGDDDISYRLRENGYKLILCRDTFVHHNHLPNERNTELETIRFAAGRKSFLIKHYGLDAWTDMNNHLPDIGAFLPKIVYQKSFVDVLGVDVRCGNPLLEFSNQLRHYDRDVTCRFAGYTTQALYYHELCKITQHVTCGAILDIEKREEQYDVVVLGEAVNGYQQNVEDVLSRLIKVIRPGGWLICFASDFRLIENKCRMMAQESIAYWPYPVMSENEIRRILCMYHAQIKAEIPVTIQLGIRDKERKILESTCHVSLKEALAEKVGETYYIIQLSE